jgi:hypothetical protein
MNEIRKISKNEIRNYIDIVLPSLKLSISEKKELFDEILTKYPSGTIESNVLKEIVSYLDKRPLFTRNLLGVDDGIYRSMEGNADEMIIVGKLIKMGFNCSRVDVTNSKYDAVIDRDGKLLRVQIKATSTNSLDLTCGGRAGQQINRTVPSRQRKLTKDDCDILIGAHKESAICYVIPANDLEKFGSSISLSQLGSYKENWDNIK